MRIVTAIAEVPAREPGKRRVLVPTMGALHNAHGELIKVARENAGKNGEVAVSIFVNPLQFEPGSDYERYPRPEMEDEEFCRTQAIDRFSSTRIRFRSCSKENRGPDIFAAFARWWPSSSTFCSRTRLFSAKKIFNSSRSFVGWFAI